MLAEQLERGAEQADRGFLSRREQVRCDPDDVDDLRQRAVRKRRGRETGEHVGARLTPALLHVLGESLVQELERAVLEGTIAGAADHATATRLAALQLVAERVVIGFGHTEEVGHDQHRERRGEVAEELALARAPNSSIWRSARRHMNSSFSFSRFGVIKRMSSARWFVCFGGSKVVIWSPIGSSSRCSSISVAHVVTLERYREPGERSGDGVARREPGGVVVHRDGFLVARHHDDVVMELAPHRALAPQPVEVRIRVLDHGLVPEEVDGVEVGHGTAPLSAGLTRAARRGGAR